MQASLILAFLAATQIALVARPESRVAPQGTATPSPCGVTQDDLTPQLRAYALRAYRLVLTGGVYSSAAIDYQTDLAAIQAALACEQEYHAPRNVLAPELGSISAVETRLGRYSAALQSAQEALAMYRALGDPDHQAYEYTDIGNAYDSLGEYREALEAFQNAVTLFNEANDLGAARLALNDVAISEESLREYREALQSAMRAQWSAATIGLIESDLRQYGDAWRWYRLALQVAQQREDIAGESTALAGIGEVEAHLRRYRDALAHARQAVVLDGQLGTPRWPGLATAATAEANLGRVRDALRDYASAVDDIESLRANVAASSRTSFFTTALYVYDEYIHYLLELERRSPGKGNGLKALEIFERRQSRAFLEEITASAASAFGVPVEISAEDNALRSEVQGLHDDLAEAESSIPRDDAEIASVQEQLSHADGRFERFEQRIKISYPRYYALRNWQPLRVACAPRECTTFTRFRSTRLLASETVLVYDMLGDETALWTIAKNGIKLFILEGGSRSAAVRHLIVDARPGTCSSSRHVGAGSTGIAPVYNAFTAGDATLADVKQAAKADALPCASAEYALYRWLLPSDALAEVKHASTVFVVPTGLLYGVPFEALVTRKPALGVPAHYLIEDRGVAYIASASLLNLLRANLERHRPKGGDALLAFADPDYADRSYPPLPGSRVEALAAFRALHATPTQAAFYDHDRATVANLLALDRPSAGAVALDQYRFLLFGAHAALPSDLYASSQPEIVLAHPAASPDYVTMADALGLTLNAQAVVLSACDTAGGDVNGYSVQGLTQAFMYAGTPVVGMTYWIVADFIQPRLTPAFFAGIADGDTPADALRRAKLKLIYSGDPDESNPFFWAPMVTFGDADAR
jgi:CHAT domain-containing protein/tetratricopeptide (TPR) repeat protein